MSIDSDSLLSRNARFAASDAKTKIPEIPFVPNGQLYVLTCIDPRVDPASTLQLELGDAIVARTVGGRANRSFLEDLAWICFLHRTKTPNTGWFDVVVIHHTDCGSALMADDELRARFVAMGHDDRTLLETAVTDPRVTVSRDVQLILDAPFFPVGARVTGYQYDTAEGTLSIVVPTRVKDA